MIAVPALALVLSTQVVNTGGEARLVPTVPELIVSNLHAAVEETTAQPAEAMGADEAVTGEHAATAGAIESGAEGSMAPAGANSGLQRAKRVAVYDFELQGIEPNIGTVVTDSFLAEIRKLQGISVIGMDEIKDMLSHEANKQILGCEANDSCLAEIAGALGVDDLITGKLSKVGDNHVLVVRRIDQMRAKVVGVVNKRLKAESGQEFLLAVGPSVEELFPERQLRQGMKRGVAKEVALRLDPPPLPTWSFWTVAGSAAAAGAVGGVLGLLALQEQSAYHELAQQGVNGAPVSGSSLKAYENSANERAMGANVSYVAAGVLAVTAGIMFLFTDWEGYGEVEE